MKSTLLPCEWFKLQGIAGLVCRKKLRERRNGDGMEAAADDGGAVASSVQLVQPSNNHSQPDSRPSVHVADSVGAVHSSHVSSSAVTDQSEVQQFDVVTERLADLELSGGLRHRQRNGQRQDVQDSVLGDDTQRADEPDLHRN